MDWDMLSMVIMLIDWDIIDIMVEVIHILIKDIIIIMDISLSVVIIKVEVFLCTRQICIKSQCNPFT